MEFLKFLKRASADIIRVPVLAGIGYGIGAYMRDCFDLRIFLGFTVGITVLQTLIIFIVWYLLKQRKAKNETAYSESN